MEGEKCMEERITGVMIYYYFVCKRKLWYFCHEINMESGNEDVQLGKILDETSYGRSEKHIQINGEINIDFIKEHRELHEIKKSKSIEQELNFLHLKKEASKLIVRELENSLKKTIKHKELGRQVSYQYLIRLELYKLIKHIIGEKEYEGFKIWW